MGNWGSSDWEGKLSGDWGNGDFVEVLREGVIEYVNPVRERVIISEWKIKSVI